MAGFISNANNFVGMNICDLIYPVGSIYMSVNSTSPATLFGGTWTQIKDTFLLAAGNSYRAGATGGEAAHTLTTSEMPSHTHRGKIALNQSGYGVGIRSWELYCDKYYPDGFKAATDDASTQLSDINSRFLRETSSTGDSAAHNNMPPYLAVYMWKREA